MNIQNEDENEELRRKMKLIMKIRGMNMKNEYKELN